MYKNLWNQILSSSASQVCGVSRYFKMNFDPIISEVFDEKGISFLSQSPQGLLGYCFHPLCPDGQVAGKSLSGLYLRNRKVLEVDTW